MMADTKKLGSGMTSRMIDTSPEALRALAQRGPKVQKTFFF